MLQPLALQNNQADMENGTGGCPTLKLAAGVVQGWSSSANSWNVAAEARSWLLTESVACFTSICLTCQVLFCLGSDCLPWL